MKEVGKAWKNKWGGVVSIEEVCKNYGAKNVIWCFKHFLYREKIGKIIDIGCGAGFYFNFFKNLGFKELHGLEYDKENIEKAKELNKGVEVKLIKSDVRNLSNLYEKNYFDVAVSLGLIEHFKYPVDIIRRILTVVKKDGVIILEMPNFRNCFYYSTNIRRKNFLPFHLWWGIKEWSIVLEKIKGCKLEKVQTGDFWSYRNYLPRVLGKVSPVLVDFEITIENKLFKKLGSLAFYKLRKI